MNKKLLLALIIGALLMLGGCLIFDFTHLLKETITEIPAQIIKMEIMP